MSDLNNFMMFEDLKITEQEQKFINDSKLHQEKKQLQNEMLQHVRQRNIGSFS